MLLHTIAPPTIPADLKLTNRLQIIDSFLTYGVRSANDISAEIGLSRQTVMKSIQFFQQRGLITSVGKGESTSAGGKRPELFALSSDRYFLCIALWPLDMRLHLYTIGGQCIDQIRLQTPLPDNPRSAIANAGTLAHQLLDKNGVALDSVYAVSLSTAGTLDYKTRRLKFSSLSPSWGADVPLADELQPYFAPGTLIFLENAGKMAARPYLLEPALSGKRVLSIFSCWGLSSCLIEKGHILSGKNSLIGEIGHMVIDPSDPERCGCGSTGCFERLVSAARVQKMALAQKAQHPNSLLFQNAGEEITFEALFSASSRKDPLARELVANLASSFAIALRNITLVFDPDLIVFQGDYAFADAWFDQCLRQQLRGFQYFPTEGPFDIRYDRRHLEDLDALGSYISLVRCYFGAIERYID